MSQPETGALITEYSLHGRRRTARSARCGATGHEDDRELHLALTAAFRSRSAGGFFFVFQTGVPVFRKYDAAGQLVFERRDPGPRDRRARRRPADEVAARARPSDGELPLVTPTIRTAAVDPDGSLWIAFVVPFTYVFDGDGDKIRTVQFRGAGIVRRTACSSARTTGPRHARPVRVHHAADLGRLALIMAPFIAAVVQNAPVVFDAAATLGKIDALTADAAKTGATARRLSGGVRLRLPEGTRLRRARRDAFAGRARHVPPLLRQRDRRARSGDRSAWRRSREGSGSTSSSA